MKFQVVSTVLCVAVCAGSVWAATTPTPQQIVDERIVGMKTMGGNLKATAQAATPAEAKAKIAEAIAFAESIPTHFPKGTGVGDAGVTKTRALQDIWAKPAEFKAASDALVAALKGVEAALGGDKAKVDAAFGAVGPSCGGCHKLFRGPETP